MRCDGAVTTQAKIATTARKLTLLVFLMFGFGYALVPLYQAYCDLTGRGKVVGIDAAEAHGLQQERDGRLVTVVFDANTRDLSWEFRPRQREMRVHPGALTEAAFLVRNKTARALAGRAIPSVSPPQAGVHFNKTECFCFREQWLQPGESREVVVRFIVGAGLPERFSSLTLSYTFFAAAPPHTRAEAGGDLRS